MNSTNRENTTTSPPLKKRKMNDAKSSVTPAPTEKSGNHEKLLDEFHRLKSENERLVAKKEADAGVISKLNDENQRLLQKCSNLKTCKQTLKRENAECQLQLQQHQEEATKLQEQVEKLGEKKKSLLQKLKDARADVEGLRQYAFASDQSIEKSKLQHQTELSDLQEKNQALQAKIDSESATMSKLSRENEALLRQCRHELHTKHALECEKAEIQEKYQASESQLSSARMEILAVKGRNEQLKDQMENATKTIHALEQLVHEKDYTIGKMRAICEAKLHQLYTQSSKSLLGIQSNNQDLKRRVSELEGQLAKDAKCMKDLFVERDELQRQVIKQQANPVVFKSEIEIELQKTLKQHQNALKMVEELQKDDSTKQLMLEKAKLEKVIEDMKEKHEQEIEELQEEIEQAKNNLALEVGFRMG